MENLILRLDITGRPVEWMHWEYAALLYVREQVAYEVGEHSFRIRGGVNRVGGMRSFLDLNSIVATHGVARSGERIREVPALTNTRLFRRDGYMCMYCARQYTHGCLTRDHVVTACRLCNARKGSLLPKEAERMGIALLGIPYAPSYAEGLILSNRKILADQMAFLRTQCPKEHRD